MNCTKIIVRKAACSRENRQYNTIHIMLKSTDNKYSHICDKIIIETIEIIKRKSRVTLATLGSERT